MLDRSVIALAVVAIAAALVLWRLTTGFVEASSAFQGAVPTSEEQRAADVAFFMTYLVSPAATAAFVGALVGLPLVIGARAAALRRARAAAPAAAGAADATPRRPPSDRP
ncbi:hypothetical protein BCL57_000739 [Agromyces flavus]|uniref:Uncharacterized protein n=1 Tax=Agromyces flavus TaxID=589382 RepID=A0ABT1KL53_9MICO|nr:hypothetical protein [Agromyces flavus]MCP2366597.1 hypothetical protein [Agromyces flavus]